MNCCNDYDINMKSSVEVHCIVCQLVFCCAECRWRHEQTAHGLTYNCPICRGQRFLCKPQDLNQDFLSHLALEHLPLTCRKCDKTFYKMEDLTNVDKCTSISELVDKENNQSKSVDEKFDSLYEKVNKIEVNNNNNNEKYEGIVLVTNVSKTAVVTPIVRKKHLVDYESTDSEEGSMLGMTPHPKLAPKTPKLKRQRAATPHVKKLLSLMRQKVIEEYEETVDEEDNFNDSPTNKTTPLRAENETDSQKEITTPTSHMSHILKLAQVVTTSTPTHPAAVGGWSLFPGQGADSPLSEIENSESLAQSIGNEPFKLESCNNQPKLKSIIVTNSKIRLGSQDSSEKHVTFQDSPSNAEASIKTKKVKFTEDTIFEPQTKVKRVFRKPKRMLTPGPQKQKFCYNPRFQALINQFENQGMIMARTPTTVRETQQDTTPAVSTEHPSMPRAINFKEDSPQIDSQNYSKESNELFRTCVSSPEASINNAITAFSANIAGSLQSCISSVLKTEAEETEIQFKFTITKKKVSVKRFVEDGDRVVEKLGIGDTDVVQNKENIWSSVAKAVKNVIWGEPTSCTSTPHRSLDSSSASKRKLDDMSDSDSPVTKRQKYGGRIRCRPPLRRSKTWGVSSLKGSFDQEEAMNLSF